MTYLDRRLAVAPMLDYTDQHFRYFLRLLSRHTLLYTEMVTTGAVLRGDRERLLAVEIDHQGLANNSAKNCRIAAQERASAAAL